MRRREFVFGSIATAWRLPAQAQPTAKPPVVGFLVAAGQAQATPPAIKSVGVAGLLEPARAVHDTAVLARRAATPPGASYATSGGEHVSVDVSNHYASTPARVQRLVDFVGTLVHGDELGRLSISIRTPDELHGICGLAADASAPSVTLLLSSFSTPLLFMKTSTRSIDSAPA